MNIPAQITYAGFRPRRRSPFVSAKGPKPIFVRVRPHRGSSASAPNKMAQKLAEFILNLPEGLRQSSPKKSIRCCGSAAPKATTQPSSTTSDFGTYVTDIVLYYPMFEVDFVDICRCFGLSIFFNCHSKSVASGYSSSVVAS